MLVIDDDDERDIIYMMSSSKGLSKGRRQSVMFNSAATKIHLEREQNKLVKQNLAMNQLPKKNTKE